MSSSVSTARGGSLCILRKALSEKSVDTSDIVFRIKDFESFYGKILRRELTEDVFNSIEDVVGVRIICLYRSELRDIESLIRNKLDVIARTGARKTLI